MKKKLLKPPPHNGDVLFIPSPQELNGLISENIKIGVCHQPYFFNPGISLKFLFLEKLGRGKKEIIFLDTDKVAIKVKVPSSGGVIKEVGFIKSDQVLSQYPSPGKDFFSQFFSSIEHELKEISFKGSQEVLSSYFVFKEIVLKNSRKKYLKEILAESFLQFYHIERDYYFLSDLLNSKDYKEFFLEIYSQSNAFREIFNSLLDEYRNEFRFRYKNFPFPKLEEGELPFWLVRGGRRERYFKRDMDKRDYDKALIFPRAVTLTLFLRLYRLDLFIHGVGGGNYEWIQDRIIERFFKQKPSPYAVISGTFLIDPYKDRNFPYFFFPPESMFSDS